MKFLIYVLLSVMFFNGFSFAQALLNINKTQTNPTIDGKCNNEERNTCIAGTVIPLTRTSTHYLWQCLGLNGGLPDDCSKEVTPACALLDSVVFQDQDVLESLLSRGSDPDVSLQNCQFPLVKQIIFGLFEVYHYKNDLTNSTTLLHVAATMHVTNPILYDILVAAGADEDAFDPHIGLTAREFKERIRWNYAHTKLYY